MCLRMCEGDSSVVEVYFHVNERYLIPFFFIMRL